MTRCKFKCVQKLETTSGFQITLEPVTHGSPENEQFFKWTPFGKMEFGTINAESAKQFEPGKEYYIDISSVKELQTISENEVGNIEDVFKL